MVESKDSEYVKLAKAREAQNQDQFWWLGCLIPVVFLVWLLSSCEWKSKSACENDVEAFVIAQDFVKQQLRSPSTANFPGVTDPGVSSNSTTLPDGRCGFNVYLYVDAQNAFGGIVRQNFLVTVAPDSESGEWSLVTISPS